MSSIRNDVYNMLAAVIFFGDKKVRKGFLAILILVFVNCKRYHSSSKLIPQIE